MNERDLLVALISIGLGISIFYQMLLNAEWCFRLKTPQMLERTFGRTGAKLILGSVATALIVIGLHLLFSPMLTRTLAGQPRRAASISPRPPVPLPLRLQLASRTAE